MKFNRIFSAFAVCAALSLASCSEGQYWDEAGNSEETIAFAKGSVSLSFVPSDEIPASYDVIVRRSNSGAGQTFPVEFTTNTPLLSGADEVVFEDGKDTAVYTINIENALTIGNTYTATVQIAAEESDDENKVEVVLPAANTKFTFNIGVDYTWETVGKAYCISQFAGNEKPVAVPVQQAKEYTGTADRLLRLVSPYNAMDPSYAKEGYNIKFTVSAADGAAVAYTPTWQFTGEIDGADHYFLGLPEGYGCYFSNKGNIYTIYGVLASAESPSGGKLTLKYYETFMFQLIED